MKAYWWRSLRSNFGDKLTPVLIERFLGIRVRWAPPNRADLVGVGSILEDLPRGYEGIVLGTGKAHQQVDLDLSRARVLALRGALTLEGSRARCDLLGDPGLLCEFIAPRPKVRYPLAVIPHLKDKGLTHRFHGHVVNVARDVDTVIAEVAACERVVSSSLHGLVLADALGLPRRWETFPKVQGGGFKFRDYASSLGESIEPGRWQEADRAKVNEIQSRLMEAFLSVT